MYAFFICLVPQKIYCSVPTVHNLELSKILPQDVYRVKFVHTPQMMHCKFGWGV